MWSENTSTNFIRVTVYDEGEWKNYFDCAGHSILDITHYYLGSSTRIGDLGTVFDNNRGAIRKMFKIEIEDFSVIVDIDEDKIYESINSTELELYKKINIIKDEFQCVISLRHLYKFEGSPYEVSGFSIILS